MPGGLRTARHCIFTDGDWTARGGCRACFLWKWRRSGGRASPLSQCLSALTALPKGEPLAAHANFISLPRPLPLGEVASRSDDGEGSPPVKIQSRTVRRLSDFVLIKYAFRYSCAKQSGAHSKWSGVTRRKHRSLPAHGPRGR